MRITVLIYLVVIAAVGGSVVSCLTPTEHEFQRAVAEATVNEDLG